MKRRSKAPEETGGKWLLTFNDMVTLLLTFFVLILSMSDLDKGKVIEMTQAVRQAFGMLGAGDRTAVRVFDPFVLPVTPRGFGSGKERLAGLISFVDRTEGMVWKAIDDRMLISLDEDFLYKSGSAEIDPKSHLGLKTLCSELGKTDSLIRVEGHTDDVPISNGKFPSNWELSTARAVNVGRYFITEGGISPERLSAAGYADSKPVSPNIDECSRAQNRRVDIILTFKEK